MWYLNRSRAGSESLSGSHPPANSPQQTLEHQSPVAGRLEREVRFRARDQGGHQLAALVTGGRLHPEECRIGMGRSLILGLGFPLDRREDARLELLETPRRAAARTPLQAIVVGQQRSEDRGDRTQNLQRVDALPESVAYVAQGGLEIPLLKGIGKLEKLLLSRATDQLLDVARCDHRSIGVQGTLFQLHLQKPHVSAAEVLEQRLCPAAQSLLERLQRFRHRIGNVETSEPGEEIFSSSANATTSRRNATSASPSSMLSSCFQCSGVGACGLEGERSEACQPAFAANPSTLRAASFRFPDFQASRAFAMPSERPFLGARNSGSRISTTLRPGKSGSVARSCATSAGEAASSTE